MSSLAAGVLLLLPLLQATTAVPAVDDVRTLTEAADNDARFDAVTALLKARGIPFTVEPFTLPAAGDKDPRTTGRNIVVSLGKGRDHVLVGAHYDAARLADGTWSRGAVDNAGSSVVLVRLAERLRGEKLRMAVRIVWFDMEEAGLVGARHYLETHPKDRPVAMLNFDINGYGTTVLHAQPQAPKSPALDRAMAAACAAEGLDCLRSAMIPPGDDRVFSQAGIPSLSIATLAPIEAHQLWLMLNAGKNAGLAPGTAPPIIKTIHSAGDTIDKIEGSTIEQQTRLAAALVRQLAAARPR
jgi:Zn-dependent M28 family amino/carboxypeptidase